jgi:hypothetical protein
MLSSTSGPIAFHLQRYVPVHELPALVQKEDQGSASLPLFPATLLFPTDGLILQNSMSSYLVGHSDDLLKWKDPCHNTIDFRLLHVPNGAFVPLMCSFV